MWSPGDRTSRDVPTTRGAWRQGLICQAIDPEIVGLGETWRLATMVSRQAVCTGFSPGDDTVGSGLRVLLVHNDARLGSGDAMP